MGIYGGLDAAVTSPLIGSVLSIHICTDNLNVAQQAGIISNDSSQEGFRSSSRLQKSVRAQEGKSQFRGFRLTWAEMAMTLQMVRQTDMQETHLPSAQPMRYIH